MTYRKNMKLIVVEGINSLVKIKVPKLITKRISMIFIKAPILVKRKGYIPEWLGHRV